MAVGVRVRQKLGTGDSMTRGPMPAGGDLLERELLLMIEGSLDYTATTDT